MLVFVVVLSACNLYVGGDDDPAPDAEVEPGTAAYCLPQPVTRANDVAPELRQWILDAEQGSCWLERRTGGAVVNGSPGALATFPAPGTVSCDGGGCWEALPAFARAWSHYPAPQAFTPPTEPQLPLHRPFVMLTDPVELLKLTRPPLIFTTELPLMNRAAPFETLRLPPFRIERKSPLTLRKLPPMTRTK